MIRSISPAVTVLLATFGSIIGFISTVRAMLKLPALDDVEPATEA